MKRILSVILSLSLLASLLIIPMSVSAAAVTDAEKNAKFDAVVNAVKNLKLDLNNVSTIEYANPTESVGGSDNSGKITISTVSDVADKVTLGGKKVAITGDNKVTSEKTPGGLVADHLHAISYQPLSNVYVHLYKVGYFVIYVKTARPFKLSLGAVNGQTQNINFLNGENAIEVPATGEGYTPVAINIQSGIDWTKPVLGGSKGQKLYAAEYCLQNLYVSVQEMTDENFQPLAGDENTIKLDDGITFGSAFYVPVDENVRDFRFDVTTSRKPDYDNAVKDKFTELSAEMIAAAEAIDNTHGNYTVESFQALQDAIKTAKEVFIAGGGDVVDLFKAEVENLYTLEEVCRPTSVDGDINNRPYVNASEITINDQPLSDKQKEYFGESLVKVDNTTEVVRLTDKTATGAVPDLGDLVKKFKDYKNLYFAVANTGDVQNSVKFTSYNQWHTGVNYINRQDSKWNRQLILKNGFNLISLYDLSVNVDNKTVTEDEKSVTYYIRDNNVLYYSDYKLKYDTSEHKKYYDGFNVFNVAYGSLPAGTSLYIGSLIGEKPFNITDTGLDKVTDKANVVKYYNDHIKGKGYINTDDIEKTLEIIGLPPVITIEGNKANGTEDYCGSVEVTVTDPDSTDSKDDLMGVLVYTNGSSSSENRTGEFKNGSVPLAPGHYKIEAYDAKNNVATVEFNIVEHALVYKAEGPVITEKCSKCAHKETLTLVAPDDLYGGTVLNTRITYNKSSEDFEGSPSAITFEQNGGSVDEVKQPGEYTAKVTVEGETAVLVFEVKKAEDPYYSANIEAVQSNKSHPAGEELKNITLPERFSWKDGTQKIKFGVNSYDAIYVPEDTDNYATIEFKINVTGTDDTPPTGEIKIKDRTWIQKIVDFVFGWFIDEKVTVTITGSDTGSGVDKIYYYVADDELDSFENIEWKEYTKEFKIEKEGNNVVYAKIVDVAGESTTINTDGIVLDTINPDSTIDLDTYYGALNFTVNEANLASVQVKDADSTSEPKDLPVKDGVYTVDEPGEKVIIITDKAGRKAEYKVNIIEIKGFDPEKDEAITINVDLDENNVETAEMEKIAKKIDEDVYVLSFFQIDVKKITDNSNVSKTNSVFEIPVEFDFDGKLDIKVLHNHGGDVRELGKLDARPTANYETGKFFADVENKLLYIYTSEFSTFAVAFHVHDLDHVKATSATAEADGNIEYWYCEGCDKYFSDAIATKEITEESTFVKYAGATGGNTSGGSNTSGETTGTGDANTGTTLPGGISPGTGETAMTVVLFAILLGAIAVMGISIVKSRKAKSK